MYDPRRRHRPAHQSLLNLRFLIAKHAGVPTQVVERVLVGDAVSAMDRDAVHSACRRLGINIDVTPVATDTPNVATHDKGKG